MRRILVAVVGLVTLAQLVGHGQATRLHPHRIAVFGSSVANGGKLLKGSLEIYSPLTDVEFKAGGTAENRAQSLTAFRVGRDPIVHVDETSATR